MLEMSLNPPDPIMYECPVCGEEISEGHELYFDDMGTCVGCECCLHTVYAGEYFEELDYAMRENYHDS